MNKPMDSWWTVIAIDPLAERLVPWLSRRAAVTPTRLTGVAFGLGLLAAAAFVTGHYVVGAILFEVRFLFDCLDGKLARYRGTSSAVGEFVDVAGDMLVVGLSYGALAASLAEGLGWERYPLVMGVALVTASAWGQLYRNLRYGQRTRQATDDDEAVPDTWLARHRLKAYPSSIEVETAALFLAPLLLPEGGIVAVILAAYAFYVVSFADSALRTVRRARAT